MKNVILLDSDMRFHDDQPTHNHPCPAVLGDMSLFSLTPPSLFQENQEKQTKKIKHLRKKTILFLFMCTVEFF